MWKDSGHELLESIMLINSSYTQSLIGKSDTNEYQQKAKDEIKKLGIKDLSLASDFPMTQVTYDAVVKSQLHKNADLIIFRSRTW